MLTEALASEKGLMGDSARFWNVLDSKLMQSHASLNGRCSVGEVDNKMNFNYIRIYVYIQIYIYIYTYITYIYIYMYILCIYIHIYI